ncbi:MAG: hypothetical protein AAGC46_12070 [Solirubrobacteraceae bacterium]
MSAAFDTLRLARRVAATVVALGLGSTAPAGAATAQAAASVSVPAACYVYWPEQGSQPIPIAIRGLVPGAAVDVGLRIDGHTVSGLPSLTVDASGAIDTQLNTWTSGLADGPSRATPAWVVVSDPLTGAQLAEVPLHVANVGLDVDAARKASGTKRRWIISGLQRLGGGATYYAFYFKHGKVIGRQRIGMTTDACGYLRTMMPAVPFKQNGTFEFRVQASPAYHGDRAWIGGTAHQGKA